MTESEKGPSQAVLTGDLDKHRKCDKTSISFMHPEWL